MNAVIGYIRRFGFWRGLRFYRVAQECERNPTRLRSCANHFRAVASDRFYHDDTEAGKAFLAFAEILHTTHDKLVLNRNARRPILVNRMRNIERRVRRRVKSPRRVRQ